MSKSIVLSRLLVIITLIFSFKLAIPSYAQEAESPLLEMLGYAPQSLTETGNILSYADMELTLNGWLEVPEVNSIEDFEALSETERTIYKQSLPTILPVYISSIVNEDLFRAVSEGYGLNFFDIEQSLHPITVGVFQEPYVSLRGTFDYDTLINGRLEIGYSQRNVEDWTIICPEINCEEEEQRIGEFLLPEKYILGANLLITIQTLDYLTRSEAILAEDAPSLLDIPDYAASASLLTNSGRVSQAIFLEPDSFSTQDEFRSTDSFEIAPLPPYGLVSIAELVFVEDEYNEVHILLSYKSAEYAEIATQNLEHNLSNPNVFDATIWEDLNASVEEIEVLADEETGLFLVRAVLVVPMGLAGRSLIESSLYHLIYTTSFGFSTASWLRVEEE